MSQLKKFDFEPSDIAKLCAMQDTLNHMVHPEWKRQKFDWMFAIIDECREIKEHLGWKWWKGTYKVGLTEANKKQVQLEVIDILHFVLSSWIELGDERYLLENFNVPYPYRPTELDAVVRHTIRLAGEQRADVMGECWTRLAHTVGLTKQEIMETYVQKYVLNRFRQDHGYKDGSYVKEWLVASLGHRFGGTEKLLEDNEVLAMIVQDCRSIEQDATNEQWLYTKLKLEYINRLNQ